MEVFDIKVRGVDLSPTTYSILAKDTAEALEIAQRFNKAAIGYGDWCDVADVTHNTTITTPEQFEEEMADKKARLEARIKEENAE